MLLEFISLESAVVHFSPPIHRDQFMLATSRTIYAAEPTYNPEAGKCHGGLQDGANPIPEIRKAVLSRAYQEFIRRCQNRGFDAEIQQRHRPHGAQDSRLSTALFRRCLQE